MRYILGLVLLTAIAPTGVLAQWPECGDPDVERPAVAYAVRNVRPVSIKQVEPIYPAQARAQGIEGVVVVEVVVDEQGKVFWARAVAGPAPLRDAAVAAACHFELHPIVRDGAARRVLGLLAFKFELSGKAARGRPRPN